MSHIMEKEWIEMIRAFQKLSPEERSAQAARRLDETLERMAEIYHITPGEAYAMLVKNRDQMRGQIL